VRQKALHKKGKGFIELALSLSGNRIKHQRRFARTRDSGKDCHPLFWNIQGNIFEVVFACAIHLNKRSILHHQTP